MAEKWIKGFGQQNRHLLLNKVVKESEFGIIETYYLACGEQFSCFEDVMDETEALETIWQVEKPKCSACLQFLMKQ